MFWILGKLLAFSSQFPEVSRQISTTVISQLLALLCEPEFTQKVKSYLNIWIEKIQFTVYFLMLSGHHCAARPWVPQKLYGVLWKSMWSSQGQFVLVQLFVVDIWIFFKRHQSQLNHLNPITIPQATIEKTLYSLIDWDDMATNSYLRSKWSSCITLLPSLGGGGTLGANHKTNWIEFCLQLIDSIHSTVNDMFRNIDELKVDKQKQAPLPAHSRWSTCR